ncbi:hypothetical protein [Streptococcus sobrinus]|uniref:hypothetical protein n=1 Tax=Streptococcus sobrinus TaxID=1310 RepID=UPI00031F4F46|nr:hypothetical protein [Streptococcus sobrinus]
MNTATLDTMAFNEFEAADDQYLSNAEGGGAIEGFTWTAAGLGAASGAVEAAEAGLLFTPIGLGVAAVACAGLAAYEFTH